MRMMQAVSHLSIRTKLILIVAGTLVLAQGVTGYLIRALVSQHIMQQALTTVDILTTSILHDITFEVRRNPESDGQQIVAKYMTYYRIISNMAIYNSDLVRTASSDPSGSAAPTRDPEVIDAISRAKPSLHVLHRDFKDLRIRSVAPILQGSHIVGAVAIDVSMQDAQATLAAIDKRIGLILGLKLVLVCVALFVLLRGSILVRLRRLMVVTHQITAGDYRVRVNDAQGDEIGQLARAFDQMASDLQKSKREIDNHSQHLEERVREATAQLQKAFEDLTNAQSQLVMNEKMATLGVLIAGVTHEINTPAGAILNVSRNLEKQVQALPRQLDEFKRDPAVPVGDMVICLQALIASSCKAQPHADYKVQKNVEAILSAHAVPEARARATALCKLNFTDAAEITKYIDCFRVGSFFAFAESFASIAQAATISQTSAQKIAEIVRALKYYAHSDTDRVELTQVNDSIATALVLLDSHLKHTVTVRTDYDPELPAIPCTNELHQVWTNLLTNANDAVAERGTDTRGEISISTRRRRDEVIVSVTDNGAGIPPDKLDRIFDPFFTTKDIGKGTGLGLCIVSGIIKKHCGAIRVSSEPGRTTFEISLPTRPGQVVGSGPVSGVFSVIRAESPASESDQRSAA